MNCVTMRCSSFKANAVTGQIKSAKRLKRHFTLQSMWQMYVLPGIIYQCWAANNIAAVHSHFIVKDIYCQEKDHSAAEPQKKTP